MGLSTMAPISARLPMIHFAMFPNLIPSSELSLIPK
jgi:hypothetical protein